MFGRRRTNDENPAWPGLVDLYAFTFIIFIVVHFAGTEPDVAEDMPAKSAQEVEEELRQKSEALEERIEALTNELQEQRSKSVELEEVSRQLASVQRNERSLEDMNRHMAEQLDFLAQAAVDAKGALRQRAHKEISDLRSELARTLGDDWGQLDSVHPTLPEFEISTFRGEPILFEQAKHTLDRREYDEYIGELRVALAKVLASYQNAEIEVRGTADPDPYRGRGEIKDNIDLSAMRAATVAKRLKAPRSADMPGIKNDFIIVGLGETGDPVDDPDLKKDRYRQYRSVRLKIRIPIDSVGE